MIEGSVTLPKNAVLNDYIFGDLVNFGIKVDERLRLRDARALKVTWVQFTLGPSATQTVHFPVCLRRKDDIDELKLTLEVQKLDQTEIASANILAI